MNGAITAPEVLLIDADGQSQGVLPRSAAQSLADAADLDLVEVSPAARPPVCKILDYSKYRYALSKRTHNTGARTRPKTVKFHMRISEHDRELKLSHIRSFLAAGKQVNIVVELRGRERAHPEFAAQMLADLAAALEVPADQMHSSAGRASMVVAPRPAAKSTP